MEMPTLEDVLRNHIKELEKQNKDLKEELKTEKVYSEYWKEQAVSTKKKLRDYIDKLRNKIKLCNSWEREAIESKAQLGEIRMLAEKQ